MIGTMSPLTVCVFIGILSLAHCHQFSPSRAVVNATGEQKTYTAYFDGSQDMVVYWEYRFDTIFPRDADAMTVNPDEASASMTLTGFHEIVRLVLYENERDMAGSKLFFLELDGEEALPAIDVSLSADVVHIGQSVRVTATVNQPSPASPLDEFQLSAEFVGVNRSSGTPLIVNIPSYEHQAHITCNKVSQEGDTYVYDVIPPNAEGLLFVRSALFASQDRPLHTGVAIISVVKILPESSSDLFEDDYFGIKSNKYGTGELPCTNHHTVPCLIECVALGPDIQGIELYASNGSLAYTAREDIRHGDTFMRSRFSFDDKTLGPKGPLTCRATSGSRTAEDNFGLMVYEHVEITSFGVEKDGNERTFTCSATGYPLPDFTIYVTSKDLFYDKVEYETQTDHVNGLKTVTYSYVVSDEVTMLNCQAQSQYSFGFKQITDPE